MEALNKMVIWNNAGVSFNIETVRCIGGKALGLHELKSLGIHVPAWATITSSMFKQACVSDKQMTRLLAQENIQPQEKATLIRGYLKNITLDDTYQKALAEVWNKISNEGKISVAVRSSAADEDSKILSFAGQMDSFLNIRSLEAFLQAIRGCWASLFGERAVLYRIQHGINPWDAQIAVINNKLKLKILQSL